MLKEIPKQCVILVGGKGTRLGDLTAQTPKPLLTVGGLPFLDYLIEYIQEQGCESILLLAGHQGTQIYEHYRTKTRCRLPIECVIEREPAGTAGSLILARERLHDQFFVCNGDSIFKIDFSELASIPSAASWQAKLALRRVNDPGRYGSVALDGRRVTGFCEKGATGESLINGGVYVFRKSVLESIEYTPCSLEQDVFPKLIKSGTLFACQFDRFFIDIGVPTDFDRAQTLMPHEFPYL